MPPIPLLLLMAITSPVALNIYSPAMPDMVTSLGSTQFLVQLGTTLYLLTLAIGQFFAGPLADKFGRRPLLLIGFFLHVLGGVVAITSVDVSQLLIGRILQALGGCTGTMLARAIILDNHSKDKAAGIIGYMTMAIAISQAVMPTFGGYTNLLWGWQSVIMVNIVLGGLVLLFAYYYLPEQKNKDTRPFTLSLILSKYQLVFEAKSYVFFALSGTLIASCFFAFLNSAPFIVRTHLGGNSAQYGIWFLSVAIGFMIGSFSAGKLSHKLGTDKMVLLGNTICLLSGLSMCVLLLKWGVTYQNLFIPMACFTFGRGISQPSAQSSALNCVRTATGTASGMLGFIQLLVGALVAQVMPIVFHTSLIALPIFLIIASIAAALCYEIGKKMMLSVAT